MTDPFKSDRGDAAAREEQHARWRFFRDVAVFQFKLMLDNMRDFALVPVSLLAALIDVFVKGEREGALFYKVLEWGWHSERVIDLYSMIDADESEPLGHDYTVDRVLRRVERAIVEEHEKGGTAASLRAAVDAVLDQVQREGGERVKGAFAQAAGKLRETIRGEGPPPAA